MLRNLGNFVAFQICWFACVVGAAGGNPLLGVAVVLGWMLVHVTTCETPVEQEVALMVAAALVGITADSALVLSGQIAFPPHAVLGAPTTAWMVALWVALATTLGHSLGWLRGRYLVAALGAAICGPFAYWAGSRLGALSLTRGPVSLLAVGALWLLAMPALLAVQRAIERRPRRARESC